MKKIFKDKKIRSAIIFTIFTAFIYSIGRQLVIPGIGLSGIYSSEALSILSLVTGGSLEQFGLFSLGLGPFITSSIIIELLSMDVVQYLKELRDQGKSGRLKLQNITRYLGVALAIFQAYSMVVLFDKNYHILVNSTFRSYAYIVFLMAVGSVILQWLGGQITKYGIGNGGSLIILFGILNGMPRLFTQAYYSINTLVNSPINYLAYVGYVLLMFVILFVITLIYSGVRKIPIMYTGRSSISSNNSYLPIKPGVVSVMPLIFASSAMSTPLIILSYFNYPLYEQISTNYGTGTLIGTLILTILIILFGLFYANIQLDPEQIAENLKKNNGYIPSVRPGKETISYIKRVVNNTSLVGIIGLIFLVVVPQLISLLFGFHSSISFGGTALILCVAIINEIINTVQINLDEGKYKRWF